MNPEYAQLMKKAQGRYFDEQEAGRLRAYAEGLLARLEIAERVEQLEDALLDDVVDKIRRTYPDLESLHGRDGYQKVRRDQLLILRYCVLAMVTADPNMVRDKLAVWLRTILSALVGLERILVGLRALAESLDRHLPAEEAALVRIHLEVVIIEFESVRSAA